MIIKYFYLTTTTYSCIIIKARKIIDFSRKNYKKLLTSRKSDDIITRYVPHSEVGKCFLRKTTAAGE